MKFLAILFLLIASPMLQGTRAESPPASFAYVLQADSLAETKSAAVERIATCERDWIVLDAHFDARTPWNRGELDAIRHHRPGRKIIAYISIGEAEDYRSYWHKAWADKGRLAAAPAWLGAENPEWKGNYRVKYWHPDWQKLIFAAIDDAMSCGFDGVYLDIVDGFQTFEQKGTEFLDNRLNPETKQTYRRDMVDWVKAIAAQARAKNPAALVIPQNGSQLLVFPDFLEVISAIGIEDLCTLGDKPQPKLDTDEVLGFLKMATGARKPVLLIEYPKSREWQGRSKKMARENGMIWLVTDRPLRTLGESGK